MRDRLRNIVWMLRLPCRMKILLSQVAHLSSGLLGAPKQEEKSSSGNDHFNPYNRVTIEKETITDDYRYLRGDV